MTLNMAPLHIGPLMEQYLWHEKATVILTSATLTTQDGFDYLRSRLNADEADELQLGSPFDYETAALLYLVNDIPEPSDVNGHQRAVEQVLIRLSKATGGRLLALFTSYAQLRRTSNAITPALSEAGIIVYEQGEGASPNTLLETFREADKAVLLGTRSFWEGVDIPGDALSVLVMVKLPFDVPTDPIIAARSETFEDPFNEYQPAGSHPALPPGFWPPDPHPIRPRRGGHPRPAHPHQALRPRLPRITAHLQRPGRPDARPARLRRQLA